MFMTVDKNGQMVPDESYGLGKSFFKKVTKAVSAPIKKVVAAQKQIIKSVARVTPTYFVAKTIQAAAEKQKAKFDIKRMQTKIKVAQKRQELTEARQAQQAEAFDQAQSSEAPVSADPGYYEPEAVTDYGPSSFPSSPAPSPTAPPPTAYAPSSGPIEYERAPEKGYQEVAPPGDEGYEERPESGSPFAADQEQYDEAVETEGNGVGGYLIEKASPPTFVDYTNPRAQSRDLARQRKVRVKKVFYGSSMPKERQWADALKARRARGPFEVAGLGQADPGLVSGAASVNSVLAEATAALKAAVDDAKATGTDTAIRSVRNIIGITGPGALFNVLIKTRGGSALAKLGGARSVASKILQTIQEKWFGSGLQDLLLKQDPALAKQTSDSWDGLNRGVQSAITEEQRWKTMESSFLENAGKYYYTSLLQKAKDVSDVVDALIRALKNTLEAAAGTPGWVLLAGGGLALLAFAGIFRR